MRRAILATGPVAVTLGQERSPDMIVCAECRFRGADNRAFVVDEGERHWRCSPSQTRDLDRGGRWSRQLLTFFQTCDRGPNHRVKGIRMHQPMTFSRTSAPARNSSRLQTSRQRPLILIALTLVWLSPTARAELVPPPDGGYPNGNTAEGANALFSLTSGGNNTAIGDNALIGNTSGSNNTATGYVALDFNTTGSNNTATGGQALFDNTTGGNNTATGYAALYHNTTGFSITANGAYALNSNTTGVQNTASGGGALFRNTTGNNNTASGVDALYSNTTGSNNLANGYQALYGNTTGNNNMATGALALYANTTGFYNMANGSNAMVLNTTGSYNVAEGLNALRRNTIGSINTAVGLSALLNNTTGGSNIALGGGAGSELTTGSNNIDIGNVGMATEANTIRIGKVGTQQATYIAGISGKAVAGGVGVMIDGTGHLGTIVSSKRYKEKIAPMDKASEAILALQPMTFRYKHELDPDGIVQFGLVAEDVEKVNPDLVARDEKGRAYTVRYEAVNVMLLNEFLKEHRKNEQQERKIEDLKATIVQQAKDSQASDARQQDEIDSIRTTLKEQAAQIQKVSAQSAVQMARTQLANLSDAKE